MSNLKICRICLRTETKMYNYDRFQLKYYYEEIMALKVAENDDLPQYFCFECATLLHKFHKFKEKCYNGQRALKEIQWRGNITYEAVYKVDRQKRNLESSLNTVTLSDKIKGFIIKETDLSSVKQQKKGRQNADDFDVFSDYCNEKELMINGEKEKESNDETDMPYSPVTMVVNANKESVLKYEEYKKRKHSKDDEDDPQRKIKKGLDLSNWKVYTLTEEQALEEFRARAEHPKYVAAMYKCTECFKGFSKKEMLDRHVKKRHFEGIGEYECWFCHMRYKWKCMLRKHMVQHYHKFECLRCDLVCMQENTAILHEEFHSGELKQCIHCDQKFKHLSTYYTHLRTHRSAHVCSLCGNSFVSEAGLHQHKQVKHADYEIESPDDDDEVNTFCGKCDVTFETRKAYEEHMFHSAMHADDIKDSKVDLSLTGSKKIFNKTEKAKIITSLRTVTKPDIVFPSIVHKRRKKKPKRINRKPTTCYQCGKHFETQAACMRHHLETHPRTSFYSPADRHICEICGASLAPGSVAVHLNIHTRETLYTCDTCGRQFHTSVGLKRHLVTHTGEKKFMCRQCDKRFTQSNSLKLHVKTFHLKHPYPKRNRRKKDPEPQTTVEAGVPTEGDSDHSVAEPEMPEPQIGIEPVLDAVPVVDDNVQYLRL